MRPLCFEVSLSGRIYALYGAKILNAVGLQSVPKPFSKELLAISLKCHTFITYLCTSMPSNFSLFLTMRSYRIFASLPRDFSHSKKLHLSLRHAHLSIFRLNRLDSKILTVPLVFYFEDHYPIAANCK